MPNFRPRLMLFAVLLCAVVTSPARAADPPAPAVTAAAPDSSGAWSAALENTRAAYQAGWTSRQQGRFNEAVGICDRTLARLTEMLALDPDMGVRRELTDLQARISGLRDAAHKDLETAATAKATGNEPDEKTLNTPAMEAIDPQWNDQVEHWVEFFTGAGRSTFERWLKRSGRYMGLFRTVLQREGLPPDLVHLVFVESGFNVNARSVSAAVGPWQFLRGTGKLFGLTVNQWTDERRDPEKSTVAAARYLKHLYEMFGDWPLALASYNAGEGTVMRAIKKQGTTNYWDLRLPRQTEDYVPQFMACLAIARDPGKYGFDTVPLDDPMEFDEIAFKGAVDLRAIAKMADCDVEQLKELNPAVLRHAATGRDGITTLRVPQGKGAAILARLEDGARMPAVDLTLKHKVGRGETLQKIADTYHVSARRLALANGIGRRHPLRRGMSVTIPASLEAPAPAILEAGDPRASTGYVPVRNLRPPVSLGGQSNAAGRTVVTVRRGETLADIADRYHVSVDDIRNWNHLRTSRLRHGTRLKLRLGAGPDAAGSPANGASPADPAGAVSTKSDAKADDIARAGDKSDAKAAGRADALAANSDPAGDAASAANTTDDGDANAASSTRAIPAKHATRTHGRHTATRHGTTATATHAAGSRSAARTVVVRHGDTLSAIAGRNGVTIAQLRRANDLRSDRVHSGQRLKIPQG